MNKPAIIPDHILSAIIARHLGKASETDLQQVSDFLQSHPECLKTAEDYQRLLFDMSQLHAIDADKAWKSVSNVTANNGFRGARKKLSRTMLAIAAVLIPLLVVTGLLFIGRSRYSDNSHEQYSDLLSASRQSKASLVLSTGEILSLDDASKGKTFVKEGVRIRQDETDRIIYSDAGILRIHSLITPRAGEYQIELSDGTRVWINSDSRLDFPTVFDEKERRVSLSGEAFFEVTEDAARPFIIATTIMEVVVTGTALNICHYPGEAAITTLVEGELFVSNQDHRKIKLYPGQQASVATEHSPVHVKQVNTTYFTSWVDGMLIFRDMPLHVLANRIERWYDVEVVFTDHKSKDIRFTGAIKKEKPVSFLVDLIEKTSDVRFSIKDNKLLVSVTGNNS
jgi:transmembrane sensor